MGLQAEGGNYQNSNTEYLEEKCVPPGNYEFTIEDSYGDGICCSYGEGSYVVKYEGVVEAEGGEFTGSEATTFGSCTPAPTEPSPTAPSPSAPTPTVPAPTAPSPTVPAPTAPEE